MLNASYFTSKRLLHEFKLTGQTGIERHKEYAALLIVSFASFRYIGAVRHSPADDGLLRKPDRLPARQSVAGDRRCPGGVGGWLLGVETAKRRAKATDPFDIDPATTQRWANPEAETFSKYDQLMVRRAILRLKPDQQQVIILRFIENIEFSDIARALGKNEGNVRVIQHRALQELKRLLTPEVNAS